MGRIPDLRQIVKEDFDKADQSLVDKLGYPINNFMQQVITVLKRGIDFNNLNQQIVTFTASVDTTGTPTVPIQFQSTLLTKIIGLQCINAVNTSSIIRYPQAGLFVSYSINGNLITITNIAGLGVPEGQTNSDTYTFTILTYGANLPIF